MLAKRQLPNGKVEVTFSMPALEGVTDLHLAGDFNEWNPTAHALTLNADGAWSVSVVLEPGEYQYRYLANDGVWHNDWQADAYRPNEHGTDNSVVRVVAAVLPGADQLPLTAVAEAPAATEEAPKKKRTTKPKAEKPAKDPAAPKKRTTKKKSE